MECMIGPPCIYIHDLAQMTCMAILEHHTTIFIVWMPNVFSIVRRTCGGLITAFQLMPQDLVNPCEFHPVLPHVSETSSSKAR